MAAERVVARLMQTNAGLSRFKCVGKLTLSGPNRPVQSLRAAMAGQLTDRLRIDMFAPFGGSAGSVASDGEHLFLVMHASREYYKRRFGSGNLRRMVQIDITVGDLLELLVGRIPVDADYSARWVADANGTPDHVDMLDGWGRTRQRITVDESMRPVQSVWFDSSHNPTCTLTVTGQLEVDGFVLPRQIDLVGESGERVAVAIERYEANVSLDENLFRLAPPSS
jgi:hypothetical protein